jgi:methylmalonyl-CoA/ethylmalonyl-CoA epimerase
VLRDDTATPPPPRLEQCGQSGTVDTMPAESVSPTVPGEPGEVGVVGIDHVGIAVSDLDAAVAWHAATLGLRELHREANDVMGVAEAMLGGPDWQPGQAQVQLLAPLTPDSPIARFLDRSGPGVQHLAYSVRNVDHAARVLRAKGFRLLYDAARPGTRGSRINFVHPKDAGGVLMELVQPAEHHGPHPPRSAPPSTPTPSTPSPATTYDLEPPSREQA